MIARAIALTFFALAAAAVGLGVLVVRGMESSDPLGYAVGFLVSGVFLMIAAGLGMSGWLFLHPRTADRPRKLLVVLLPVVLGVALLVWAFYG